MITPFDVAALPRVSRAELDAQAQLRAARATFDVSLLARALGELVGAPVELREERAPARSGADTWVAIGLSHALDDSRSAWVDVEASLARELVARALKHPASALVDATKPPSAELRGAFAAVIVAALRRVGAAFRVSEAPVPSGTSAHLTVTVGGSAFAARVTFPRLPPAIAPDLARLGDAPLALRIVATSCVATRPEIAALEPGDVFLPGLPVRDERNVALVAPTEERGLCARVGSGNKLVVTTVAAVHSWDPPMTTESKAPLDVVLDAPVVVRVEVGSVQMTAREWAALNDGDVIATGVKLAGSPAVLRVGGVEVAHGELVNVDGEYGVRIVGTVKR